MRITADGREAMRCVQCSRMIDLSSKDQAQLAAFGRIDLECTGCNTCQRIEWQHSSWGMKLYHATAERMDASQAEVIPELTDPESSFEEGVGLNDPRPSKSWSPSPRQIAAWGPIVREETRQTKKVSGNAIPNKQCSRRIVQIEGQIDDIDN